MDQILRSKRVRKLVKTLNKERKSLTKQVEILCTDMINAHRELIENFKLVSFSSAFYQKLLGARSAEELLIATARYIQEFTNDADVAFFLKKENGFEAFNYPAIFRQRETISLKCFNDEVFHYVCSENRVCDLQDLLNSGLETNLGVLKKFTAAAIPLNYNNNTIGFMLITKSAQEVIRDIEIKKIAEINQGLSKGIHCKMYAKRPTVEHNNN